MFLVSHFRVRRILFTRHEKNLIKSLNPFDRSEKGLTRSRKNLPHDFRSEFGRDECAPLVAASRRFNFVGLQSREEARQVRKRRKHGRK